MGCNTTGHSRKTRTVFATLFLVLIAGLLSLSCDSSLARAAPQRTGRTQSAVGACGDGSPILVVTDTVGADNSHNFGQFFVAEMLRTEGLLEFAESELTDLDGTCMGTHDVIILPSLNLTSGEATLFSDFVDGGGFLVGLRPDQQLAGVFNVTPEAGHLCGYEGYEGSAPTTAPTSTICDGAATIEPGNASECTASTLPVDKSCAWCMTTWVGLDTSHAVASGLESKTMKIHGAATKYSLGGGTQQIAKLFSSATTATAYPAVTYYANGSGGRAAMFTYDLAESIVTTRQGNFWLAGPNKTIVVGGGTNRANQMFMDDRLIPTTRTYDDQRGSNWNEVRDGHGANDRNAVPQADEQMHVLTNLILWGSETKPLPRLWYHENGKKAVMAFSSDGCNTSLTQLSSMRSEVRRRSHRMAAYSYLSGAHNLSAPASWHAAGDEVSIHFDDPSCGNQSVTPISYSVMESGVGSLLSGFSSSYPTLTARTSRNHCLTWASVATSSSGTYPYPAAQAKILDGTSIQMDTSYSTFPNNYGYMTGSGLPMRFVDACGSKKVLDVYQLATQFEDDVQAKLVMLAETPGVDEYSMRWHTPSQAIKYHEALSSGRSRYHGVLNPLFHSAHWQPSKMYEAGLALLDHARATGIPVVPPRVVNSSWSARRSVSFDSISFSSNTLSFTVANAAAGQTLLVPVRSGSLALVGVSVDGVPSAPTIETLQGITYGRVILPTSASVAVTADYDVAYAITGSVGSAAASSTKIHVSGSAGANSLLRIDRVVTPDSTGSYAVDGLWPGSFVLSALSDTYAFAPASQQVQLSQNEVVNFSAASGPSALGVGHSLFTTQVPYQDPVSATAISCFELGMRFKPNVNGVVTHLKFWKTAGTPEYAGLPANRAATPADSGTHTATLWNAATQARLGSVTWNAGEETDEGWQQKALAGPAVVLANTTYIVSANCNENYVYTPRGFDTPVVNRNLSSDTSVSAGVYSSTKGAFPTTSYFNSNYFRDVVFVPGNVGTMSAQAPAQTNGSGSYELGMKFTIDVAGTVRAIRYWRAPGEAASGHTGRIWSASGTQLASVAFSGETACGSAFSSGCWQKQDLTTPLQLSAGTYVVSVNTSSNKYVYTTNGLASAIDNGPIHAVGGNNGVYNSSAGAFPTTTYGNTNYFRDVIFEPGSSQTLLAASTVPTAQYSDSSYDLGMIFSADVPGYITAVKYYKATSFDGGVHVGKIWNELGEILTAVVFDNETASGWQQQTLETPLLISSGVSYTVSVNTGVGSRLSCTDDSQCPSGLCEAGVCVPKHGYVASPSFFGSLMTSGHLTAPASAGVYGPMGSFPTTTYNSTGYLRDVVFVPR